MKRVLSAYGGFTPLLRRAWFVMRIEGIRGVLGRWKRFQTASPVVAASPEPAPSDDEQARYERYMAAMEPSADILADMRDAVGNMESKPRISILMAVDRVEPECFDMTVDSLLGQIYPEWELCLSYGQLTSTDVRAKIRELVKRERRVKLAPNKGKSAGAGLDVCLTAASGDFFCVLAPGDVIPPFALYEYAVSIAGSGDGGPDMLYGDEDQIDSETGKRHTPFFKPDWSPEALEGCMYTGNFVCFRTSLGRSAGGFRDSFQSARLYDFVLRFTEKTDRIVHLDRIVYHWRSRPDSTDTPLAPHPDFVGKSLRALQARAMRVSGGGTAKAGPYAGCFDVRHKIRDNPLVSIVIPTAGRGGVFRGCAVNYIVQLVKSIYNATSYRNIETIVVDNDDLSPEVRRALAAYPCKIVHYHGEFNVARKMNIGAENSRGQYLLFMNDDIFVSQPDWIGNLLQLCQRDGVGAVGPRLVYENGRVQHEGVTMLYAEGVHTINRMPDHIRCDPSFGPAGYFFSRVANRNYLAVTGAVMMTPRNAFESVGGFDEQLSVNYNDADYCLSMIDKGLRVVYAANCELCHHESASRTPYVPKNEKAHFLEKWNGRILRDPYFNAAFENVPGTFRLRVNLNPPAFKTMVKKSDLAEKKDVAVVYLSRGHGGGPEEARAFFESYDRHPAKRSHELVVILKGWDGVDGIEIVRELARSHSARCVELQDDGFDIGAYFRIVEHIENKWICFFNTHSYFLHDGWLDILCKAVESPGVGAASCTGNWGTTAYFLHGDFIHAMKTADTAHLRVLYGHWKMVIRSFLRYIPMHPNPHIRTNAFIVGRDLWKKYADSMFIPKDKRDCYIIEHGRRGFSRFVERSHLRIVVVGKDGKMYRPAEWPMSGTFASPGLPNLLIGDNQRDSYLAHPESLKRVVEHHIWGRTMTGERAWSAVGFSQIVRNWRNCLFPGSAASAGTEPADKREESTEKRLPVSPKSWGKRLVCTLIPPIGRLYRSRQELADTCAQFTEGVTSMETIIAGLQGEIERNAAEMRRLEGELQKSNSLNRELQAGSLEKDGAIHSLRLFLDQETEQRVQLDGELGTARAEIADFTEQVRELRELKKALEAGNRDRDAEIDKLRDALERESEQSAQLDGELKKTRATYAETVRDLRTQKETLTANNLKRGEEIAMLRNSLERETGLRERLDREQEKIRAEFTNIMQELRTEKNALTANSLKSGEEIAVLRNSLERETGLREGLDRELEKTRAEIAGLTGRLEELQAHKGALAAEVEHSRAQLSEFMSQNALLVQRSRELEMRCDEHSSRLAEVNATGLSISQTNSVLVAENYELRDSRAELEKRNQELTGENQQYKSSLRQATSPYADIGGEAPLNFYRLPEMRDGDGRKIFLPPMGLVNPPFFNPILATPSDRLRRPAHVNMLVPSVKIEHTSGGINTLCAFVAELARREIPVRIIVANVPANEADYAAMRPHIARIGELSMRQADAIEFLDANNRTVPIELGEDDVFVASAWWTAQMIKHLLPLFKKRKFIYVIQDFEPLLHSASTNHLLALETYSFNHFPVFNSELLREYFVSEKIGNFRKRKFAEKSLFFAPTVDRSLYYPEKKEPGEKRKLLLYARPHSDRNLLELGVGALMKTLAEGYCDPGKWEFYLAGMGAGGKTRGVVLSDSPEVVMTALHLDDLRNWAKEMRGADLVVSLIQSPHTSYPPLEAAAGGAVVVTNTWSVKTEERLSAISPNFIGAEPSIDGIAAAVAKGMRICESPDFPASKKDAIHAPDSWRKSFAPIMPKVMEFLKSQGVYPSGDREE